MAIHRFCSCASVVVRLAVVATLIGTTTAQAAPPVHKSPAFTIGQFDIQGPAGSAQFGAQVVALPNGNIVVTDPGFNNTAGAIYLYNGATGVLISRITGSHSGDQVGSGGVYTLTNGSSSFVILSPKWANGPAVQAGAVTWSDGVAGITGVVSITNSLVGGHPGDEIGLVSASLFGPPTYGFTALGNARGDYVVDSPNWANGVFTQAGAVTWADGATGITGSVSPGNSLVGSQTGDLIGAYVSYGSVYQDMHVLANSNYVVASPQWANGVITQAGAVTWGNGVTGIRGLVSVANSLVGSHAGDKVGGGLSGGVTALNNGNYVVGSLTWANGGATNAGAATWGSGTSGVLGAVSAANSLVGSQANDYVGVSIIALRNGNYVVNSNLWANGSAQYAGASTWANGTTGIKGPVSAANSLVGSQANDHVGNGATELSNTRGDYVVTSWNWANGTLHSAGAVTWVNGSSGITGPVSVTNSLVGGYQGDEVGNNGVTPLSNGNYVVGSWLWTTGFLATQQGAVTWGNGSTGVTGTVSSANSLFNNHYIHVAITTYLSVVPLANGNYVVISPEWENVADTLSGRGAVTWADGTKGITGPITITNSLVGSMPNDNVGDGGVLVLNNSNYVVSSLLWANGAVAKSGAVTWADGTKGITGPVTIINSLVGTHFDDSVGAGYSTVGAFEGGTALNNSRSAYVVCSPYWANGVATAAGAVTWADGTQGITGPVTVSNSLVGSHANDQICLQFGSSIVPIPGRDAYVVASPYWANGAAAKSGAITLAPGSTPITGGITITNSVLGIAAGGGISMTWAYDNANWQLVVGRPADNTVTLYRPRVVQHIFVSVVLRA